MSIYTVTSTAKTSDGLFVSFTNGSGNYITIDCSNIAEFSKYQQYEKYDMEFAIPHDLFKVVGETTPSPSPSSKEESAQDAAEEPEEPETISNLYKNI